MSAPSRHTVESLVRELLLQQVAATPPAVATSGVAPTLLVNSSARHMHISPENLAVLFGPGAELTVHKWL
jgi:putative phosphotransacetylase